MDVGIHVMRMILSGIFDKLPGLKIISGHWGELVPSFLERLDYMLKPEITGLKRKVSDYYKGNIVVRLMGRNTYIYSGAIKDENIFVRCDDFWHCAPGLLRRK